MTKRKVVLPEGPSRLEDIRDPETGVLLAQRRVAKANRRSLVDDESPSRDQVDAREKANADNPNQ